MRVQAAGAEEKSFVQCSCIDRDVIILPCFLLVGEWRVWERDCEERELEKLGKRKRRREEKKERMTRMEDEETLNNNLS